MATASEEKETEVPPGDQDKPSSEEGKKGETLFNEFYAEVMLSTVYVACTAYF